MSDSPNVDVQIRMSKSGDGAEQAKTELESLKASADSASVGTSSLHFKLIGFRAILHSVGQMAQGGATAVSGFARALAGVVTIVSSTAIGKIAMIAATVAAIGVALWEKFKPARAALDDTAAAAGRLQAKLPDDLGTPGIPNAIDHAKQLTAEFEKAAAAAERTRKAMDELSDAEMALKLAQVDRAVAAGEMSAEQGQQARIEVRLGHEQAKIARERLDVQNKIAAGEAVIAQAAKDYEDLYAAAAQTEAEIQKRGGGVRTTPEDLGRATSLGERQQVLEANMLQQRLAQQRAMLDERRLALGETQAKISPELEAGKTRLGTLDVLAQAAGVSASAQSMSVAADMARKKDEQEARAAADRAAYNSAVQAAQEERRLEQEKLRKAQELSAQKAAQQSAQARAAQALDLQQAQEESARIQFSAAGRAAGQKGLSPAEQSARAQTLQTAQARFGREQTESVQAKAIAAKIKDTTDPAALQNLIRSIEALGSNVTAALNQAAAAVNQVNAQVATQASQLKNGGLRTQ